MHSANCLIFPDGDEWIVFAPMSGLILRANDAAADGFRGFVDKGLPTDSAGERRHAAANNEFLPDQVTIYCTNLCAQNCVYCYGQPAHGNRSQLNVRFCRAAMEYVMERMPAESGPLPVCFHGVGEPTLNWPLFTQCVSTVRDVQQHFGVGCRITLSTGGQVTDDKAEWITQNLDLVIISIDGPRDVQNRQRPRLDGHDSLDQPLRLARRLVANGNRPSIKSTITNRSVGRMTEIVEFVASEIGKVPLVFDMMFAVPWATAEVVQPPNWEEFVFSFGQALDRGAELGVEVQHAQVSLGGMGRSIHPIRNTHFALVPPNTVTAFHDIFEEASADPALGAYGWFDPDADRICFDHDKRQRMEHSLEESYYLPECMRCVCWNVCFGPGGAKGRVPRLAGKLDPLCQMRIGVSKELLRRAVPRRAKMQESNL